MFAKPATTAMVATRALDHSRCALRPAAARARTALPPAFSIFSLRALGERVRRDGELLGELAVAEDLDAVELALDEAALAERRLVDLRAGGEDARARRR